MYLKRMELFGFKSFAEKSELELSPGIAAVVGPNGCGKSNLVDAVRWALGEQSVKSLRGTRMEEVIFSGSENRKPLNFAEVSLTFAGASGYLNLDYDEITITRRLFRSGDSEYYINKSPCRLKDVTEMFLDTGLGKEVYSVIGQGRVDEIINSRPEDRREIFEEAAGIFKYKMRKREARRRLDETRENLVRVQDLIYELMTQVEPLQEQAEITRQYRSLQDRIDSEEKRLFSHRLRQSRDHLNRVNRQLQSVNDALMAASSQEGLDEKEIHDLKNRIQEIAGLKKEQEDELGHAGRSLEQRENELKLIDERVQRFREQAEQNRNRIKQLEVLMEELSTQKAGAEEDLQHKKKLLAALDSELAKLNREMDALEKNTLPAEVENIQEQLYLNGARREAAISTVEELKRRLKDLEEQKTALQEANGKLKQDLRQKEAKSAIFADELKDLHEGIARAEELENTRSAEHKKLLDHQQQLTVRGQKIKEKMEGISSRLSLLREQDSAMTGYYRGVKEIMQAHSRLSGIIGPVASLIEIEDIYVQAIETSLGGALQYLVAESESAVHLAIGYLKEGNRGWATFLPLDILHEASQPLKRYPGWRNLPGVIGKASELVRVNNEYRKAVDYLMSSIMVCKTLDDASKAARFTGHSCRVVTLEGELINPGGVIRGGSPARPGASMPLGRRKEIEKLVGEQSAVSREMDSLRSELLIVKDSLASSQKELEEAEEARKNLENRLNIKQKERDRNKHEAETAGERLRSGEQALDRLVTGMNETKQRISSLEDEVAGYKKDIAELEIELAGKKEDYRTYQEKKKDLEQRITGTLVRISSYREQHDNLENRIEELANSINRPAAEIKEKEHEYKRLKADIDDNKSRRQAVEEEMDDLNAKKAGLIGKLENETGRLQQVEAELIEYEEKVRQRRSQSSRREKRERQLSLEQTRLQAEIEYQELRFQERFNNLELDDLEPGYDPGESESVVDIYREDRDALGEVNLGAIDELARLEERIGFLKDQKEDLHKGEESLCEVLAEIDQRMEYYFKHAFEIISDNFKQTFSELFEGGQVLLKLTDSGNMLESGIEIVAQPPGKKLQNITLLSAGEKVLTAIALVFAILRFKPAPFYLLDEVESTLDDANLTRFTKFLKKTTQRAQFIMITHRKRTMEEADVLYGVTMPEPGISKLMSLKLEDNIIKVES